MGRERVSRPSVSCIIIAFRPPVLKTIQPQRRAVAGSCAPFLSILVLRIANSH